MLLYLPVDGLIYFIDIVVKCSTFLSSVTTIGIQEPVSTSANHIFIYEASLTTTTPTTHLMALYSNAPGVSGTRKKSLPQLIAREHICYFDTTYPLNHSHLCHLKCRFSFFSYWPSFITMQHTTLHTTSV